MMEVKVLSVDDWVCVYVNGESVFQGHSIDWFDMMNLSFKHGFNITHIEQEYIENFDDSFGSFPQKINNLDKYLIHE